MIDHEHRLNADLRQLAAVLAHYTNAEEQRLRSAHPKLLAYLELMIVVRPVWGGGFDVLGEIYATAGAAEEARLAAIMLKLSQADRGAP